MTVTSTHDAQQAAGWLRQCLSQDKRPIGLMLGAGCPCAAGMPDADGKPTALIPAIAELTRAVSSALQASSLKDDYAKLIAHFTEDKKPTPDAEKLLTHIRSLRSVAGDSSTVRNLTAAQLQSLDDEICREIVAIVDKSLPETGSSPYDRIASWIRSTARAIPVEIFTTNYDLLAEHALERHRVPYFDGFTGAREPFFEPRAIEDGALPAHWTRLWKLHGSINWVLNPSKSVVIRSRSAAKDGVAVIHPSHLKYEESRRMPYLAMLDRLRRFLRQPSVVMVVSGYSFGDQHINELLVDALRTNQTGVVFATMRGSLDARPAAVQLAAETHNLSLMGKDEAIIGGKRSPWGSRSSADIRLTSAALDWTQVDPADKNSPYQAEFRLGSFDRMGDFFAEIVGDAAARGFSA